MHIFYDQIVEFGIFLMKIMQFSNGKTVIYNFKLRP